jgi:hypothetical protein
MKRLALAALILLGCSGSGSDIYVTTGANTSSGAGGEITTTAASGGSGGEGLGGNGGGATSSSSSTSGTGGTALTPEQECAASCVSGNECTIDGYDFNAIGAVCECDFNPKPDQTACSVGGCVDSGCCAGCALDYNGQYFLCVIDGGNYQDQWCGSNGEICVVCDGDCVDGECIL